MIDSDILDALKALVVAALPQALVLGFGEPASFPEVVPPDGMVLGFAGDPGDAEIDLSPPVWNYEHPFPMQVAAGRPGKAELDALLVPLGLALAADRTLGGLCDTLLPTAPVRMDRTQNEATLMWAEFDIVAQYATDNPLG